MMIIFIFIRHPFLQIQSPYKLRVIECAKDVFITQGKLYILKRPTFMHKHLHKAAILFAICNDQVDQIEQRK